MAFGFYISVNNLSDYRQNSPPAQPTIKKLKLRPATIEPPEEEPCEEDQNQSSNHLL